MKKYSRKKRLLFWQLVLEVAAIALLVSACSFPGSSSSSATTTTRIITPTPTSSHPRTVANQPPTTGKLPVGQPLPQNEVKSLTFNLAYNDATFERDLAQAA